MLIYHKIESHYQTP